MEWLKLDSHGKIRLKGVFGSCDHHWWMARDKLQLDVKTKVSATTSLVKFLGKTWNFSSFQNSFQGILGI